MIVLLYVPSDHHAAQVATMRALCRWNERFGPILAGRGLCRVEKELKFHCLAGEFNASAFGSTKGSSMNTK